MRGHKVKRFDIDTLRRLAGDKAFARGEDYHQDGQVEILTIDARRVLAQVAGTDDYRTELIGRGTEIGGNCSCPAFEDWGFCKHMVAVALAANAAGGGAEAEGEGALSRIRAHLREIGVDALVEMILELAEHDPALHRRLDMAAAVARTDDKTLEPRLRKAIEQATRTRRFVDYGAAARWAAEVDAALDAVAALTPVGCAGIALKLSEWAIDRIEQATASIDDSNGHCGELLYRARDIHLAAARAVRPDPIELAHDLFAREIDDEYGIFEDAAALYADVLGERGLTEYRHLAAAAWEKLAPCLDEGRWRDEPPEDHGRLMRILDVFAERDGDIDLRIALRAKDLSSPWSYLQLAEFCLSQGREDEALRRAEEGLWVFEDDLADERLVIFAVGLLSKSGRKEDAMAHLRRMFEKKPSLDLYAQLKMVGGDAERARALRVLEARLSDAKSLHLSRRVSGASAIS